MHLEYSHTVPANFAVGVKMESLQAFWMCDECQPSYLGTDQGALTHGLIGHLHHDIGELVTENEWLSVVLALMGRLMEGITAQ